MAARHRRALGSLGIDQDHVGRHLMGRDGAKIGLAAQADRLHHRQAEAAADRGHARRALATVKLDDVGRQEGGDAIEKLVVGIDQQDHPGDAGRHVEHQPPGRLERNMARRARKMHEAEIARTGRRRGGHVFGAGQTADLDLHPARTSGRSWIGEKAHSHRPTRSAPARHAACAPRPCAPRVRGRAARPRGACGRPRPGSGIHASIPTGNRSEDRR